MRNATNAVAACALLMELFWGRCKTGLCAPKSLCPVPAQLLPPVPAGLLVWQQACSQRRVLQARDVFTLSSSGVPALLFTPCHSHCSEVWLPLEAGSGTAVAGLVSAVCSTGFMHIPHLCPCWGPACRLLFWCLFFLSLPLHILGSTFTWAACSAHTWLPLIFLG